MVYPTWCGRGKLKVFGQAFFKKLARCGAELHDLKFLRKQRRKGEKSPSGTFLGGEPSPGGAGRRWRPFSADRAGRRDLSSEPKVRSKVHQSSPVPPPKARAVLWRQRRRWDTGKRRPPPGLRCRLAPHRASQVCPPGGESSLWRPLLETALSVGAGSEFETETEFGRSNP